MKLIKRFPQVVLGLALIFTGVSHLTTRRLEFQAQVPNQLKEVANFVVLASGFVEIALGVGLVVLWRYREAIGWLTAIFFVAIFWGNISQFVNGTDAFGLAQSLADTCSVRLPDVLVNVIVPLAKRKDTSSETEIRENQNVLIPTTNLFELISGADLYLGGCGTSVWESLYIGTPMACVAVADNQELTYGRLVDKELVIGLGVLHSSNFDAERIAEVIADALAELQSLVEMTQRGQAIVDGRGRERIVARAEQLVQGR
jgi:uncharacterized membrane protein